MRKTIFAGLILVPLLAGSAFAGERMLDGALGGAAGGLVFGPVGLVAGAVVGATAGPAIASSWGLRHKPRRAAYRRHYRY